MAKRKKVNIEDLKSFKELKKGLVELEKRFEEIDPGGRIRNKTMILAETKVGDFIWSLMRIPKVASSSPKKKRRKRK